MFQAVGHLIAHSSTVENLDGHIDARLVVSDFQ
jgi:hypothetical protein